MADYRYIHKRASHGERIQALTHLEFRVWAQYQLSADDYGVMRATATVIRADNPRLEKEPLSKITAALKRIELSGLIVRFEHQGDPFLWQLDWQDFQMIRHPRQTPLPAPSLIELQNATAKTRALFLEYHRLHFGNSAETDPIPTGAHGRETLPLTQTQTQENPNGGGPPLDADGRVVNAGGAWRPAPLQATRGGALVSTGHRRCDPAAALACGRGLCVPAFLVGQWRQQLTPDGNAAAAERAVATFVRVTLDALPAGPIGDEPLAFWRAAWAAAHGSQAPAKPGRRDDITTSNLRGLRDDLAELQALEDRRER